MAMVWHDVLWCGVVWYGVVWYGMVWYGMLWHQHAPYHTTLNVPADKPKPVDMSVPVLHEYLMACHGDGMGWGGDGVGWGGMG